MENQRIRLSKTMLKNALIELLGEKPLEKITVYEICARAQINRTTFYKYYGSPSDLLEDIVADFFREFETRFSDADHLGKDLLQSFLELLREKKDICQIFITGGIDSNFARKVFNLPGLTEKYPEVLPGRLSEKESEYYLEFFCNGAYAVVRKWISGGFAEPIDTIAVILDSIRRRCLA